MKAFFFPGIELTPNNRTMLLSGKNSLCACDADTLCPDSLCVPTPVFYNTPLVLHLGDRKMGLLGVGVERKHRRFPKNQKTVVPKKTRKYVDRNQTPAGGVVGGVGDLVGGVSHGRSR